MVERKSRKRQEPPQGIFQKLAEMVPRPEERTPEAIQAAWEKAGIPAEPINPIEITDEDKAFLQKHIGTESGKHGDYYVRTTVDGQPSEEELWYLVPSCLGREKDEAIKELDEDRGLSGDPANAAHMFINRYPTTSTVLVGRYMPDSAETYTARVRQTTNPRDELNLKP